MKNHREEAVAKAQNADDWLRIRDNHGDAIEDLGETITPLSSWGSEGPKWEAMINASKAGEGSRQRSRQRSRDE